MGKKSFRNSWAGMGPTRYFFISCPIAVHDSMQYFWLVVKGHVVETPILIGVDWGIGVGAGSGLGGSGQSMVAITIQWPRQPTPTENIVYSLGVWHPLHHPDMTAEGVNLSLEGKETCSRRWRKSVWVDLKLRLRLNRAWINQLFPLLGVAGFDNGTWLVSVSKPVFNRTVATLLANPLKAKIYN